MIDMNNDWMIDIESTGLCSATNGILSIAAVEFDRQTFKPTGKIFFVRVDMLEGRVWDQSTIDWWKQHPEAYASATSPVNRLSVKDALTSLTECVGDGAVFWAKPSHFDYPYIDGYYKAAGIRSPFHYRKVIDVRSWIEALPEKARAASLRREKIQFGGTAHDPIDDCLYQIEVLRASKDVGFLYWLKSLWKKIRG